MKKILTILTIFLIITSGANFASAESTNEETLTDNTNNHESKTSENRSEEENRIGEKVKSKENGNYNISFDDDYNGYCIDYGDYAARTNDKFIVQNTSSAVNHNTGESVGNYLKTFFVDFYDIAIKDKYETQRIIWAFTDDYDYHDKELLKEIKEKSLNQTIPDHGATKIINNTQIIFDFEVLDSIKAKYQNFFGYKLTYNLLPTETENQTNETKTENNTTQENQTNETKTENNTTRKTDKNETKKNQISNEKNENNTTLENHNIDKNLIKHATGNPIISLFVVLMFIGCILRIRKD